MSVSVSLSGSAMRYLLRVASWGAVLLIRGRVIVNQACPGAKEKGGLPSSSYSSSVVGSARGLRLQCGVGTGASLVLDFGIGIGISEHHRVGHSRGDTLVASCFKIGVVGISEQ